MADDLKIKVNGKTWPVEASPDTPLLYVLSNELGLKGPRFGCGLAQCGSCSVLADGVEIRSCITPVADVAGKAVTTLEGLAALYAQQKGLAQAPALHPLQQAFIDEQAPHCGYCYNGMTGQRLRAAGAKSAPDGSADSLAHERPSLSLRHLSADHVGDPARLHSHFGRHAMTAAPLRCFSRRDLLKGAARSSSASASPERLPDAASAARGDVGRSARSERDRLLDRDPCRQHRDGLFRQVRARPGQHHRPPADRGRRARSRHEPAQGGAARHQRDADQGATVSSSSIHRGGPQVRAAAAEARQALLAARLDPARRADRQPHRLERRRLGRRPADAVRSSTAISSATSRSTSSSPARRRRSRSAATSSSARACRASTSRTR